VKTVLPGAAIGLLGGGEAARMLALAARQMGYRVSVYSPDRDDVARSVCDSGVHRELDDLISLRQFVASVDVVAAMDSSISAIALDAVADCSNLQPSAAVIDAVRSIPGAVPATDATLEFVVTGARGANGSWRFYSPIAIDRAGASIDIARMPAAIGPRMANQAAETVRGILDPLEFIGVASAEFSLTGEHELERGPITPFLHAAGCLTVEACVTSQFEQHLRAICGLPLGSVEMLTPAASLTLRDSDWQSGEPDWAGACVLPELKLHVHGPHNAHLTAIAPSATRAKQIVRAARLALIRA